MANRISTITWLTEALKVPTDACIIWPFSTVSAKGYGRVVIKGRRVMASHQALILSGQPRPEPPCDYALHTCPEGDNTLCVNPAHLRWGTAAENNREMFARGRSSQGEGHSHNKLTAAQVRLIRSRDYSTRGSYESVGREFGVTGGQIRRIALREQWTHLP